MPGNHWYIVPRVGYPDAATFGSSYLELAAFHDDLWARTGVGPERTVLGGFSQGTVMSYALGLGPDRPSVAGILALSGFIPTVEGWHADLPGHADTRVFMAHGRRDPVIDVEFARLADRRLSDAGLEHEYHESDAGHHVDPSQLPLIQAWIEAALTLPAGGR
jgi:phospholipase/carboxylesterase